MCDVQPWMFDVQVISVSLSQKPIVSPYQRGTSSPEARHRAVHVELAADVDVGDEVARDARQDLHELRRDHDLPVVGGRTRASGA